MNIKPFTLTPQTCNATTKRLHLSFISQYFSVCKIFEKFFETNFRATVSEAFNTNFLQLILNN